VLKKLNSKRSLLFERLWVRRPCWDDSGVKRSWQSRSRYSVILENNIGAKQAGIKGLLV
jgi:hypothetical protein